MSNRNPNMRPYLYGLGTGFTLLLLLWTCDSHPREIVPVLLLLMGNIYLDHRRLFSLKRER